MKRVLITGGSRGIGKAIADRIKAQQEYEVIAPPRSELNLENAFSITNYFKVNKSFDILINNAGINILSSIEEVNEENINSMFETNLKAPMFLIKNVVPHMKENNWGRIINISSIWGQSSRENRSLYPATKFGLNGITKSLCYELGRHNILVNSICPGFVNTDLTKKNISDEKAKEIKAQIPMNRFAEPNEIAEFVNFLISDQNTYITGQSLIIDGGFLA